MLADGFWSLHIICTHCAVLSAWIGVQCGGTVTGELIEDIAEHGEEYERMDLKFLAICARSKWTWPEGTARYPGMPVPLMPEPITLSEDV
jgi:hypothetical protein